jgi:glycerophosphoryl diester phosphodiesterase
VDVRRRPDGVLVLHHDDASAPGAPQLADALELVASSGAGVMLDLKQAGVAAEVADQLAARLPGVVTVVSGRAADVRAVKRVRPDVLAGRTWPVRGAGGVPLVEHLAARLLRALLPWRARRLLEGFDVLVGHHRVLGPRGIAACHALGAEVYAWTVDDPQAIAQLVAWGVDGVIADDPASLGL